jgi:hypothetical protein
MGILKSIKKTVKKTVKKALSGVTDNSPDKVKPNATLGPAGDTGARVQDTAAANRRRTRGRGRDSTIITSRSEIGSRTLLG